MALAAESLFISVQDYLEGEKMSEVRHEYLDGDVAYRQLKSLREYLILEQDSMKAVLWRREKREQWSQWNRYEIPANEILELSSIDFCVKLSALHRGVSFPPTVSSPPARKRPASK
jgi:hypothetical protein